MPMLAIAPNLSIRETCDIGGWSRSWYYAELKKPDSNVPRPIKIGSRTYVRSDELDKFIKSRPRLGMVNAQDEVEEHKSSATESVEKE